MTFEHLIVSGDGPITTVTINRPERSNALNTRTIVELRQAIEATQEARVIVSSPARAKLAPLSAGPICTNSANSMC